MFKLSADFLKSLRRKMSDDITSLFNPSNGWLPISLLIKAQVFSIYHGLYNLLPTTFQSPCTSLFLKYIQYAFFLRVIASCLKSFLHNHCYLAHHVFYALFMVSHLHLVVSFMGTEICVSSPSYP